MKGLEIAPEWLIVRPMAEDIEWLSTADAARRLGITSRTLYRFIDQGEVAAYRFGRVIRIKATDVDQFIEASRIEPGTLEHLYPEAVAGTD
jgi:excisionase family DNA binding protein